MDYKVLYRKYRPDDFSNIIGQDYMVSILQNAIKNDKISHAYIFSGPRGTGKTSTAKVFAAAINCLNPGPNGPCHECQNCKDFNANADIIEIDAASNNGVDEIREIINNIKLAPAYSKYKVYIIDEVHMLSTSAFNALLLTLEEPPKHVVFILATTNIEAVPITILSRCQRFDFHKISLQDIVNRLKYVTKEEQISISDEAIEEIAYISDGGLRDALSILDQLSSKSSDISIQDVLEHFGSISKKQISDFYNTIVNNEIAKFNDMVQNFKNLAIDYKLLIKKFLEHLESEAIKSKTEQDYQGLNYKDIKELVFELAMISNYVNINIDPYLLIEITILKYFNKENNSSAMPSSPAQFLEENNPKPEVSSTNQITRQAENLAKQDETLEELKRIRINNCFVNAKKEYLQNIKNIWPEFMSKIDNKTLLNLLVDSNIVAASDTIIILTNISSGTVNLINKNLDEISSQLLRHATSSYKFIALTENSWQEERNTYINNLKNKIEYQYIDEPFTQTEEKKVDNIEKIAYDIFDKEKIEFE